MLGCDTTDGGAGDSGSNEAGPNEAGTGGAAGCARLCVASPADWSPAELLDDASASCGPGESVLELFDDPSFEPVECECTCGPPAPTAACGPAFGQVLRGSACDHASAVCHTTETFEPGVCMTFEPCFEQPAPADFTLLEGSAFTEPVNGACAPMLVGRNQTPPRWGAQARLCLPEADAGACGPGETCVSRPMACVMQRGEHACPEGYPARTVLYGTENDGRDCSACTCGAVAVECTNPRLTAYSAADCSETIGPIAIGACAELSQQGPVDLLSLRYDVDAVPPAACPSLGGEPTGSVTATDPVTVCCE